MDNVQGSITGFEKTQTITHMGAYKNRGASPEQIAEFPRSFTIREFREKIFFQTMWRFGPYKYEKGVEFGKRTQRER